MSEAPKEQLYNAPAETNPSEFRRGSIEQKFGSLEQMKRSQPHVGDIKEAAQEQYAPTGAVGQAWNKFARGVGLQGPK